MRNGSSSICCSSSPVAAMGSRQVLGSQAAHHGWWYWYGQLNASHPRAVAMEEEMMRVPLLHGLVSLNVLLLVAYLLLFLLAKLFARLCRARDHGRDSRTEFTGRSDDTVLAAAADVAGGERQPDTLFWFDEAVFLHHDTAMLDDQGKDHLSYTGGGAAHGLQAAGSCTFPAKESTGRVSFSPSRQEDHRCEDDEAAATAAASNGKDQGEAKGILTVSVAADVPTAPEDECHRQNIPVAASPEDVSVQVSEKPKGRGGEDGHEEEKEEEDAGIPDVKMFVNGRALADTKKVVLPVEGGGGGARMLRPRRDEEEDNGDSSCRFGASTLTSESTSKSSVEWHGSAATKDAYSELFSSSSRRSSARWESYTLFRKYDEDMVYFHRVGAQKLTETESFRSIKYQPRSMSQRITHKLSMAPTPPPIGLRDPYPELERVYVAQICLTWEALNWNYTSFRRHNGGGGGAMPMLEDRCCPARVAQEFQQFQVLLYRFIENEPFEQGRRPEIYARMKNSSPKLLLVPEFREEEDEKDDLISAVQFLHILEESIRTFMAFLRADKRSHYQMFREMVRRRASAADQSIVIALKKANKHKKSRLKDVTRPRRCLKRSKARDDEVVPVLLGLIDLKVVARVLRMPEITDQQLHWCEEKMNRVRVDVREGKLQRDPSPLFFPAH